MADEPEDKRAGPDDGLVYKFVELSLVTDESLEETVNETVKDGWSLDRIHFVVGESSRRPQMAFLSFTRRSPPAS